MMAKQNANPGDWDDSMADGCSGVIDFGFTKACNAHDRKYFLGGTVEDKLVADGEFYYAMCRTPGYWGWIARHGMARIRYNGVRFLTYNYPPGHPSRNEDGTCLEAFNWLGPGPD